MAPTTLVACPVSGHVSCSIGRAAARRARPTKQTGPPAARRAAATAAEAATTATTKAATAKAAAATAAGRKGNSAGGATARLLIQLRGPSGYRSFGGPAVADVPVRPATAPSASPKPCDAARICSSTAPETPGVRFFCSSSSSSAPARPPRDAVETLRLPSSWTPGGRFFSSSSSSSSSVASSASTPTTSASPSSPSSPSSTASRATSASATGAATANAAATATAATTSAAQNTPEAAATAAPRSPSIAAKISELGRRGKWAEALSLYASSAEAGDTLSENEKLRCSNAAITALGSARRWERSLAILRRVGPSEAHLLPPNSVSYGSLIAALGRSSMWERSAELLEEMTQNQLDRDIAPYNAAINVFQRASKWQHCISVLDQVRARQRAQGQTTEEEEEEEGQRALEQQQQQQQQQQEQQQQKQQERPCLPPRQVATLRPDERTFGGVLSSLAKGGDWLRGLLILEELRSAQLHPDLAVVSTMMSACLKGGAWPRGLELLDRIDSDGVTLDKIAYETALALCRPGGLWPRSIQLLNAMEAQGISVSVSSVTSALKACDVAGDAPETVEKHLFRVLREATLGALEEVGAPSGDRRSRESAGVQAVLGLDESLRRHRLDYHLECQARQALYSPFLSALLRLTKELPELEPREERGGGGEGGGEEAEKGRKKTERAGDAAAKPAATPTPTAAPATASPTPTAASATPSIFSTAKIRQKGRQSAPPATAGEVLSLGTQAGLGTYFTTELLAALGLSSGLEDWTAEAQDTIAQVLIKNAAAGAGALSREKSCVEAALSLPREPSKQTLVVWTSYLVGSADDALGARRATKWMFQSDGRVVAHGAHDWAEGEAVLPPVFVGHDRSSHAERRALLQVAEVLIKHRAEAARNGETEAEPTGTVRLFSSHTPCVSCLAAFAQFRQRFPRIKLVISFAPWDETRAYTLRRARALDEEAGEEERAAR